MTHSFLLVICPTLSEFDYCNILLFYFVQKRRPFFHFFVSDEQIICHGLETLIEYYQGTSSGLITPLGNPIIKDPPPPDTRRHGRTNLLHRATKEGMHTCVLSGISSKL
jgi:hypothetical protein